MLIRVFQDTNGMPSAVANLGRRIGQIPSLRPLKHRDFRLMWFGALFSFTGSWIQNVAQGWLVYHLTGDVRMLALLTLFSSAPSTLFAPFAGALTDTLNKRLVLISAQSCYAVGALFLGVANSMGFVQIWHLMGVALVYGFIGTVEMPTRQAIITSVVPKADVATAIPLNALSFNLSRVIGPSIGGILLGAFGPSTCYFANGLSYIGLIGAVIAVRADLKASPHDKEPIGDLLLGGIRYTLRHKGLRLLFLMESSVSLFALFYLGMMPAIAKDMLGLGKTGLGYATASVGVGAVIGLVALGLLAPRPWKASIAGLSLFSMGVALVALSMTRSAAVAYPLFALAGMSGVMQFNTTNTLFQTIAPPELKGRVIAMHVWALTGLSPIGSLFFGWLAKATSLPLALCFGGVAVVLTATIAWLYRRILAQVEA